MVTERMGRESRDVQNGIMKALVYTAPGRVELQNVPQPALGPHDVVIRVATSGICGSDVHGFLGKSRIRVPPAIMGHEFTGRVHDVGERVEGLSIGQRVVVQPLIGCGVCRWCRSGRPNICPRRRLLGAHLPGGFAEYVSVPVHAVYPLPDSLSDRAGALVEPLGNAVHMIGLGGTLLYRNIVVLGAGTLGLLAVAVARLAGAGHVIVTDTQEHRLEVARRLGAHLALDARDDLTERIVGETEGGADLVIEAVGITATRRQAIAVAAPGATVVLLGNAEGESELPVNDAVNRELALRGSYSCTDDEFRRAIAILADGRIETDSWIEMTEIDRGQEYFERLVVGGNALIKVMFQLDQIASAP